MRIKECGIFGREFRGDLGVLIAMFWAGTWDESRDGWGGYRGPLGGMAVWIARITSLRN